MSRFPIARFRTAAMALSILASCAGDSAFDRGATSADKADDAFEQRLHCGQPVFGNIGRFDSGPLLDFRAEAPGPVTLSFTGSYPASQGAVILAFRSLTGTPAGRRVELNSNHVQLTIDASPDVDYTVVAFAQDPDAVGTYELRAECSQVPDESESEETE